jgi:hypothetical protein
MKSFELNFDWLMFLSTGAEVSFWLSRRLLKGIFGAANDLKNKKK